MLGQLGTVSRKMLSLDTSLTQTQATECLYHRCKESKMAACHGHIDRPWCLQPIAGLLNLKPPRLCTDQQSDSPSNIEHGHPPCFFFNQRADRASCERVCETACRQNICCKHSMTHPDPPPPAPRLLRFRRTKV